MGTVDYGGDDLVVNNIFTGISSPLGGAGGGITAPATSAMVPKYESITDNQNQLTAAQYAVSHTIYLNDNVSGTFKVAGTSVTFGTASSSGTMQVEVATGTQAIGAGVNQLTGTLSLSGTANTPVNGTMIASPTTIPAGGRVNLIFGGTVTSLANASVTVVLQRLS